MDVVRFCVCFSDEAGMMCTLQRVCFSGEAGVLTTRPQGSAHIEESVGKAATHHDAPIFRHRVRESDAERPVGEEAKRLETSI